MRQSINEWQDFSIKKDVEKISRELHSNKKYENTLIVEIIIAMVSLLFEKLFDLNTKYILLKKTVFGALSLIAVLILFYLLYIYLKDYFDTRNNIKKSKVQVRPYVDSFDDNICYYALTACAFYEELLQLYTNQSGKKTGETIKKESFFYIETHYYINKCIFELNRMENLYINVFTDSPNDVICKSKIHFSRLKNLVELLYEIRLSLYSMKTIESFCDTNAVSKEYDEIMRNLIERTNSINPFKDKLFWVEK